MSHSSYKFTSMGNKPLAYPVYCNNAIVIPAGATGVKIAYRQSHVTYIHPKTGQLTHMNVYLWRGRLYHA